MRYFAKFDDDDKPFILFRADGTVEQVFTPQGWAHGEFMEDVIEGSFQYRAITEAAARGEFPDAFA